MIETKLVERITIIQRTRSLAAATLVDALSSTPDGSSESDICESWTHKISDCAPLSREGWYQPPPKGAAILIGDPASKFVRMNYDSLRSPAVWPRADISLHKESLIYAYASPFDRGTGLIGDIGVTLYRGTDQSIREHLIRCLDVTARIARHAQVGMQLRDLFNYGLTQIRAADLSNQTSSTKSGTPNIGHTVPWSYESYPDDARHCFDHGGPTDIRDKISRGRVSINDSATLRIQPTMAFTVEPQIAAAAAPLCSYHVIVIFAEGKKTISSCFGPLFKIFAMEGYMESALAQLS